MAELLGDEHVTSAGTPTPRWIRQAALPIKWGGLGLGGLALTAPAAYLGCWGQVMPLLTSRFPIGDRLALAPALAPTPAPELPFQLSMHAAFTLLPAPIQAQSPDFLSHGFIPPTFDTASLIATLWSTAFDSMLQDAPDSATLARLRSVSAPAAGAWLQAIPSFVCTAFGKPEFLSAPRLRLGLEDPAWSGLTCLCGEDTPFVSHVLRCGFGAPGRITVHDALRDTVAAIATHAQYQVRTEAIGHLPLRPGDTAGRRPDAALFDRGSGTWRLLDVVVCSPLRAGRLPLASTSTGAAAAHAEARKRRDYADAP